VPFGFEGTEGAEGDSLFVVVDGLLEAIGEVNGKRTVLGRLESGATLGEMSMLTGAPRSATVAAITGVTVYELTKDAIRPLIESRPEIAEHLSRLLAERQARRTRLTDQQATDTEAQTRGAAEELLGKIKSFFGLRR